MEQTSGRRIFPVPDPQGGLPEILSLIRITCLSQKGPQRSQSEKSYFTDGKTKASEKRSYLPKRTLLVTSLGK